MNWNKLSNIISNELNRLEIEENEGLPPRLSLTRSPNVSEIRYHHQLSDTYQDRWTEIGIHNNCTMYYVVYSPTKHYILNVNHMDQLVGMLIDVQQNL